MYFSTFSFIQGGIICIVNRRSTIYELPEYAENFFPLCDELETEGKWTKEEISTFPGFLMNEDGIIIVYRVNWYTLSVNSRCLFDNCYNVDVIMCFLYVHVSNGLLKIAKLKATFSRWVKTMETSMIFFPLMFFLWIIQLKNVFVENHCLLSGIDSVPYSINQPLKSIDLCFCFACFRLVCPMLAVSLDFPFLIAPSVFSNVYV